MGVCLTDPTPGAWTVEVRQAVGVHMSFTISIQMEGVGKPP